MIERVLLQKKKEKNLQRRMVLGFIKRQRRVKEMFVYAVDLYMEKFGMEEGNNNNFGR